MKEKLIQLIGSLTKSLATFSFGYMKGRLDAKRKLKEDNQHIIDMLNDK